MNIELNIVSSIDMLKSDILSICQKYIHKEDTYKIRYEFYQEISELVSNYKSKGLLLPDFQLDQYMKISLNKSGFDNCLTQNFI